jgi:hypothetical protein
MIRKVITCDGCGEEDTLTRIRHQDVFPNGWFTICIHVKHKRVSLEDEAICADLHVCSAKCVLHAISKKIMNKGSEEYEWPVIWFKDLVD